MPVYKVSYVVAGAEQAGSIVNQDHRPRPGDRVELGGETFEVVEVFDLMPQRGEFQYVHATCRVVGPQ